MLHGRRANYVMSKPNIIAMIIHFFIFLHHLTGEDSLLQVILVDVKALFSHDTYTNISQLYSSTKWSLNWTSYTFYII